MYMPGCVQMRKVQAKAIHCVHEENFLVPCGIWYRRLRHKRMEESLALAQMSLEETARSALLSASCLTAVLILVLCGWVEMMGDKSASQPHGCCGKGGAEVRGRAPVSAVDPLLGGIRGLSPPGAIPTPPQSCFGYAGPRH